MNRPSNETIAQNWQLWCEYVNPDGAQTREEWEAMSTEARLELMADIWPEAFGDD